MKRVGTFVVFVLLLSVPAVPFPPKDAGQPPRREVAITFDDLPSTEGGFERMKSVTERLLATIKTHRIPAIGFVNEIKLHQNGREDPRSVELLKMWLDAGLELGNHTYSHVYIDQVPLERYKEEVIRGEKITRRLLSARGKKLRYFRHTQLRTGPTVEYKLGLDKFLAVRGYTVAPVTIDNQDFMFAAVYAIAKQRGDTRTMAEVSESYIPYMESVFDFFEKHSREMLGYEVKQTLLLHANELNADHFARLIGMMKDRGYAFVPLEEALKDKAYRLPEAQTTKGLSWIHRWGLAMGKPLKEEPREPEFITNLFSTR